MIEMIKRHEGFRRFPYRCTAGKLTIGYGRNLEDVGISEDEAEMLLLNDVERCWEQLSQFDWFHDLNEARQWALVDMLYNLGFSRFMGFKKMLAALERRDYESAAAEMLDSKWARQVGNRAIELAEIMRSGTCSAA